MPAIDPESVKTSTQDNTITVSAALKTTEPDIPDNAQTLRRERKQRLYQRILRLPSKVDPESISWDYQDGVLTVKARQS